MGIRAGAQGKCTQANTRCGRVCKLLKTARAVVLKQKPFTIRLLYETPKITQPLWGGSDPGGTKIREAVVGTHGNAVYQAQVESRNCKIPKLMKNRVARCKPSRQGERKARQRRSKANGTVMNPLEQQRFLLKCKEPITIKVITNTEARFANRKRPDGWLTPTARQCVQTHLHMVDKIRAITPVADRTMEGNRFAFMRMEDGFAKGIDSQNRTPKGYKDVEECVFETQVGKCRWAEHLSSTTTIWYRGTTVDMYSSALAGRQQWWEMRRIS